MKMPKLPIPPRMPDAVSNLVMIKSDPLPNPDHVTYYVLEAERKIYLDQEIDESAMGVQRMILRWNMEDKGVPTEERKPITLFINSPGGETLYMWSLIDTIELSATPVNTVDVGICASAASLIFLAGRKRSMMPRARVLIHEGSARMAGDSVKVLDASDNYRKEIKQMKDFIVSHSKVPAGTLTKQSAHDWELSAEECLKYGICDEILTGLDQVI